MKDLLWNIVNRQRVELGSLLPVELIERDRSAELVPKLTSPLIKVITGPRRAGKSTLALQALRGERFSYINFEDESLPVITDGDQIVQTLDSIYGEVDYYFFDEIQNLSRWEQFLNRLQRQNKKIIVTGSNSQLLSEELSSSLTGRHHLIEVLPFNFREICRAKGGSSSLEEFLTLGGFPEVVMGKADCKPYLTALWDAVILKDIAKRKKIRNISALDNVLGILLGSITSRYNVDSLRRSIAGEVSSPTIKKFILSGVEAYLISELNLFSVKPKNRIKSDRKVYTVDNGFFTSKNVNFSENFGVLLENAVFNELRNRNYKPNLSIFYYTTRSGFEVDFLLRDGYKNAELIQVCYSLSSLKTRERELRALKEAGEELGVTDLTVVNMTEECIENYEGATINVVPAHKWF